MTGILIGWGVFWGLLWGSVLVLGLLAKEDGIAAWGIIGSFLSIFYLIAVAVGLVLS